MFISCHLPNNYDLFILYDNKDFDVKEIGLQLENITVLEPKKILTDYSIFPILNLNEFLLRVIKPNERTITHRLGELGLDSFQKLETEKQKIDEKKSSLSKAQREIVLGRYNDIITLCLTQNE